MKNKNKFLGALTVVPLNWRIKIITLQIFEHFSRGQKQRPRASIGGLNDNFYLGAPGGHDKFLGDVCPHSPLVMPLHTGKHQRENLILSP